MIYKLLSRYLSAPGHCGISLRRIALLFGLAIVTTPVSVVAAEPEKVATTLALDWQKTVSVSKTIITVQVCPEPPMRRGHAIHRQTHDALRDLKMDYARLQPWFPYPKLSIAALEPPGNGKTSWDFQHIDPIVLDFYEAAQGRPIVLNMAFPRWLFDATPHKYPDDPDQIDWQYEFGPNAGYKFRDPSLEEAAEYFRRIAEWYVRGGFTDEFGTRHVSGHKLKIDYWEVINEQDEEFGHRIDPAVSTALYDRVVKKLLKIDPTMKFSALALSNSSNLHYIEHFLNAKNHAPGIPIDMVSYHKYILAPPKMTLEQWHTSMFGQVDAFMNDVIRIDRIRNRLSPKSKIFISEFGLMHQEQADNTMASLRGGKTDLTEPKIPDEYWTLGSAVYAYGILGAMRRNVDLIAAAELVDYPGQFAGTNLIDWNTGVPMAPYRAIKMLHDAFKPGDKLIETVVTGTEIDAQAFDTPRGRKLVLINKTPKAVSLTIPAATGAQAQWVDQTTRAAPPSTGALTSDQIVLQSQAVMLVSWPAKSKMKSDMAR